jgi:hypothetical protein
LITLNAASGAAANAISNSYYYYATTHKPELPQLPVEELGELVLDEKQTMNVLQALHAICGQRNKLAKQAYADAHKHMKAARPWNHTKKLAETDQAIAIGNQFSALSDQQQAIMVAVGVALIESTRMRSAAESQ